ncbi:inovirus-type Gp2 protein [Lentisphaerota bacterium WC36G]|nr:inovirus Gp2 family protein [Lentisphaerae bacterium WC36]
MNEQITIEKFFNGKPINTGDRKKLPCYISILEKIEALMNQAVAKHSKVLFFRMDLRFPDQSYYTDHNNILSNFLESFMRNLERQGLDPHYIWVREQNSSFNPHYHVVIMLNGHKTQSSYKHIKIANKLWSKNLGFADIYYGLLYHCNDFMSQVMIMRNKIETFNDAFYWASYLAKTHSKTKSTRYRSLGMTKINNKIKTII